MTNFEFTARWTIPMPLHLGTGLSLRGIADRTIRLDPDGKPLIPGDAVKGGVRSLAERAVRWLAPQTKPETEEDSRPAHPALRRIFAPAHYAAQYRFPAATYRNGGQRSALAGTAIDLATGVAKNETLRTIEHWSAGATFAVRISGRGGTWDDVESPDYLDLTLLLTALISLDALGGHKGTGQGALQISQLELTPFELRKLTEDKLLERLQTSLRTEATHA